MNNRVLSVAALVLSAVACVLASVAVVRSSPPETGKVEAAIPEPNQFAGLAEEIGRLRTDYSRLASPRLDMPEASPNREPIESSNLSTLGERLAALEAALAAIEKDSRTARPVRPPLTKEQIEKLRDARSVTLDYGASETDRVEALSKLRGRTLDDQNAITEQVVLAVIALAEQSRDEDVRVGVYKNLHNSKSDTIRDSMMRALASDPNEFVRLQAAQDLDVYVSEPMVKEALRSAVASDRDAGVRTAAARTLASGG